MINDKGIKVIEKRLNPINKKDNKCFQYDVTVALNRERIKQKKETIQYQNQIITLQSFHRKIVAFRNEKNSNTHELNCLFRTTRIE